MFDIPADATWIWLGLLLASAAAFGVISDLPAAPPDADRVAGVIERVRAVEYTTASTIPIEAGSVKIEPHQVALRGPGGTAHASITGRPVTPVRPGSRLSDVLHGTPPEEAFPTPGTLRRALEAARRRPAEWREASETIRVRRVRDGEVDSVLVGQ